MSLAIWSLAAQNVLLYPLVPGGTKGSIVPFGPWRDKMFHFTIWSLAGKFPINMRPLRGRCS
jgi:hypothetical protein